MEIQHLDKNILFGAFAKACSDFGDEGGNVGSGECFADDIGIGCPFDNEDEELGCNKIRPSHWREVFEGKDKQRLKPGPQFQFGDKVTHYVDFPVRAVFSAYKDSLYSGEAYVLFEGEVECQTVPLRNLKAGWE